MNDNKFLKSALTKESNLNSTMIFLIGLIKKRKV